MPREYGKAWFSMWTDEDFCAQPLFDKTFYNVLLAQPAMNPAGLQPISFRRWRKALRDGDTMPSEVQLMEALVRMEVRRYVFTDDDTGELLVRSFMRRDEVDKQPTLMLSALRCAGHVESPKLAAVLAEEFERIATPTPGGDSGRANTLRRNLADTRKETQARLTMLTTGVVQWQLPFQDCLPEAAQHPSTHPMSLGMTQGMLRPAEIQGPQHGMTHPYQHGSVVVEVEVVKSPWEVTRVGERDAPPPDFCPKHPQGTDDPCRACQRHREIRERWDAEQPKREKAQRAAALAAREACTICDGSGWIDTEDGSAVRECSCRTAAQTGHTGADRPTAGGGPPETGTEPLRPETMPAQTSPTTPEEKHAC